MTTKQNATSSEVTLASDVIYRSFGPLTELNYGNGLLLSRSFDLDYRPDGIVVQESPSTTPVAAAPSALMTAERRHRDSCRRRW